MTGTQSPGRATSPPAKALLDNIELKPPNRTVIDAYKKTSWVIEDPRTKFGTGTRPPLNNPDGGPGPGAYQIKTTMGKVLESNIRTPSQFSIRGRTKFGDPNEKALSKTAANEPGPGQYDLTGKFLAGTDPRKSAFPKAQPVRDKSQLGPGPGSYSPLQSMGKQVLSTKVGAMVVGFPKADRPTLIPPGTTDIGPAEYKPSPAACEEQIDSRKPTCGKIKFGEGYKSGGNDRDKHDLSDPTPGPGAYKLPGGIGTKTKGAPYRDSPTAILSGRNKFGSPW
eukprot:gene2544-2705_t